MKFEAILPGQDLDMQQIASKRKFSDTQIKYLEFMFESESRPESRMKQQLAEELGLQPRQVATWFQNRRARLKIKQIELDYSKLKAKFDTLACSYESLKEEHHSLIAQVPASLFSGCIYINTLTMASNALN